MPETIRIHTVNLALALAEAIKGGREHNRQAGLHGDSGLVAGWVEALEAIKAGRPVEIVPPTQHDRI
jgi:hypothetical protein